MSGYVNGAVQSRGLPSAPPAPVNPALLAQVAVPTDDGGVEFADAPDEGRPNPANTPHDANLAEVLDDAVLGSIASELAEGIEADRISNAEMLEIFASGMKLMIAKPGQRLDKPFENAAGVVHPILMEACVRGSANARGEMLPAAGPVRCQVIGDQTPEKEQLAQRKQGWLNYYLTEVDEDYYPDYDQMLFLLFYYGSMFRKVYRDPLRKGAPTSRYLSPLDLLVNYSASSLNGSSRITQIEPDVTKADLKRLQIKGWYRDVELQPADLPAGAASGKSTEGRTPTSNQPDQSFTLHHSHCLLDIEGVRHTDAEGEPTGLPLPYIVTMELESRQVLRVARNWKQGNADFDPEEYFVHYKLWPGFGFYGIGMVHLLGMVADAATMMLRQAINSFTLASFPGGFRVKGMRVDKSDNTIGPCQFVEIDTGGLPLSQALMILPYKDVPPSFVPLMQQILDAGQRLASLSDVAVGDGREDSLPGTVIALIEKATKLETTIVKRMHVAHRKELRLLADLFGEDKDAKYPYVMNGKGGEAIAADFQNNADVIPVSDPNIPTQTQRLVLAQALMQEAQQNPLMDKRWTTENFVRKLGLTDAEVALVLPPQPQGQPADPVTEFAAVLKGMPIAAGPTQDHLAHFEAHSAQLATPGLKSEAPQNYAALMAHAGDHLARLYAAWASAETGIPIQLGQPMPPQMEAQIAAAVAKASDALRQKLMQLPVVGQQPDAKGGQNDTAIKAAELQQDAVDSQRKDETERRQDAIDVMRLHTETQSDAADRQAKLREAELDVERERIRAAADMASAGLQHHADMAGAVMDHVAKQTATATKAHTEKEKAKHDRPSDRA